MVFVRIWLMLFIKIFVICCLYRLILLVMWFLFWVMSIVCNIGIKMISILLWVVWVFVRMVWRLVMVFYLFMVVMVMYNWIIILMVRCGFSIFRLLLMVSRNWFFNIRLSLVMLNVVNWKKRLLKMSLVRGESKSFFWVR